MAKMGRPKTSERDDVSIKVDRVVAERCQVIAKYKGMNRAEYISEAMRIIMDRDWKMMTDEMDRRQSEKKR